MYLSTSFIQNICNSCVYYWSGLKYAHSISFSVIQPLVSKNINFEQISASYDIQNSILSYYNMEMEAHLAVKTISNLFYQSAGCYFIFSPEEAVGQN